MLTVLQRPQSCRATTQNTSYSITTNGYGTAVLSGGSGLSNGDKILITASLDSYNGFWVIDSYGPSQFRLRKYAGGPTLDYTQDASVTILLCTGTVEWSCVHLPILYKLSSNLWPTNASDSIRAVVGFANDNGLVRLTLSGSITAEELDYLNIASTSVSALDGPFQIITKWSPTQFTINAPYALATSPYTYATATAQKYYNNYHARIRIYGGLNASHLWAGLKPYALLAEYKIVPDDDGEIFLNLAETLKEKINILLNRPNYDSKPYDLDRFAQFYIEYAEVYDVQAVSTVGSYTSDQGTFEGWAADAKLEFKNRYSGFLSDYIYGGVDALTWVNGHLVGGDPYDTLTPGSGDTTMAVASFLTTDIAAAYILLPESMRSASSFQFTAVITSSDLTGDYFVGPVLVDQAGADLTDDLIPVTSNGTTVFNLPGNASAYAIEFRIVGNGTGSTLGSMVLVVEDFGTVATVKLLKIEDVNNIQVWPGWYKDVSLILNDLPPATTILRIQYVAFDSFGNNLGGSTFDYTVTSDGIVRIPLEVLTVAPGSNAVARQTFYFAVLGHATITDTFTMFVNTDCYSQYIYLTWKNNLGGFEYWLFTGNKDYNINILETQDKDKNPYPDWDKSYGEFADTLSMEVSRRSRNEIVVRSQNLTRDQIEFIKTIKTSSLVMQMTSQYDRRRVKVDATSFIVRDDTQKNAFEIAFRIQYTDEIPSQSL